MSAPLSRREVWLIFALVAGLTLAVGIRARLVEHRVDWDGLVAVAHANDVFRAQSAANLAMIGFVQPPLPALLQLPVVLIAPALATSGLAAAVQGALAAGIAAVLLLGLAAEVGLSRAWRWLLVAAFGLHPLVLGPAAMGAPLAVLTALLLGASWALMRWSRTESLRDLIAASVVLAAALITRYEAVFIVVGAMLYLAWRTRRTGGSWSKLEGTMITFALPVAYVSGVWIAANWAIMGDPWYFIHESFAAAEADPEEMLAASLRVSMVCFFPVLAVLYYQMREATRALAPGHAATWLVFTAMAAPVLFPRVFAGLAEEGDWNRLTTVAAMVLAGGFSLLAVMLGERVGAGGALGREQTSRSHRPIHGTVLIAAASLGVLLWLGEQGSALPGRVVDAYIGRGPLADTASDELAAARLLRATTLPQHRRHLIAGWPGFAVVLFAGKTGQVSMVRLPDLPREIRTLGMGSRLLVLVGTEVGGVPYEALETGLGLPPGLALKWEWQAGPWQCFEVVRAPRL